MNASKQTIDRKHNENTEIHPFLIDIPQQALDDLRDRLEWTRWPDEPNSIDWDYGVPVRYLKEMAAYWGTEYDWRKYEDALNRFPQYTTTIDGQQVHFLQVRSPESDAMPLILTHGWPGSIVEFMNIIGPLSDPRAHGGRPEDAFHLVIPSIPGFGFSGPTNEIGWNTDRVAAAWLELMGRLGYERFGVQGGDTGAIISPKMGNLAPDRVIGIHSNGLIAFPSGDPADRDLLLTNVSIYWFTGTAGASARIYKEDAKSWGMPGKKSNACLRHNDNGICHEKTY